MITNEGSEGLLKLGPNVLIEGKLQSSSWHQPQLLRPMVIRKSELQPSAPDTASSIKSRSVTRHVSWTKRLVLLMMPKEHFKISSAVAEHVNQTLQNSWFEPEGVTSALSFCSVYATDRSVCVCIYNLVVHDRGSFEVFGLGLFLWDNLSCLWACWARKAQIFSTSLQDAVLG